MNQLVKDIAYISVVLIWVGVISAVLGLLAFYFFGESCSQALIEGVFSG